MRFYVEIKFDHDRVFKTTTIAGFKDVKEVLEQFRAYVLGAQSHKGYVFIWGCLNYRVRFEWRLMHQKYYGSYDVNPIGPDWFYREREVMTPYGLETHKPIISDGKGKEPAE